MVYVWIILHFFLISSNLWEILAITNRRHIAQDVSVRNFRHIGTATTNVKTDWERGLREATTQALYREHNSDPNLRKLIQDAPLLGKQDKATPFGDIAVLARGQLYANFGGYVFVQDPYQNDCDDCHNINSRCGRIHCEIWKPRNNEQLTALWTIKRIRHRDFHGHHRYEIEYTISPINTLINQPFVTKEGRFDYAVPGHVFILRNQPTSVPQNHNSFDYKPGTLLIHGDKQFGTGGHDQTSPKYPTTQAHVEANDEEINIFNSLLETLNKKTTIKTKLSTASSTASVSSTKPTPSTTTTIVDEIPKTTLVKLPTGHLVPITDISTPFISESTSGFVSVEFPTTPLTTQGSTTSSFPKTTQEASKFTTPIKPKTTFHYFAATEEEATTESVPKITVPLQKTSPVTYAENTMFIILDDSPTTHVVSQAPLESTISEMKSTEPQKTTKSTFTVPRGTTASVSTRTATTRSTSKPSTTKKVTKIPRTTKKRYTRIKQQSTKKPRTTPMQRTTGFKPLITSSNTPKITTKLQAKTTMATKQPTTLTPMQITTGFKPSTSNNTPKITTTLQGKTTTATKQPTTITTTKEQETTQEKVTKELTQSTILETTSISTEQTPRPIVNTYSEILTTIPMDKQFTTIPISMLTSGENTVETTGSTINIKTDAGSTLQGSTIILENTASTPPTSSEPKISSTVFENIESTLPMSRSTFKEPKTIMTTEMVTPTKDTEDTKSTRDYTTKTTPSPTTHIQKITTKNDFLENDDKSSKNKGVYPIYSKVDISEDDIFGTTPPSSTKATQINTTNRRKVTPSDVEVALFGNGDNYTNTTRRSKSLKTKPSTQIIYSNFYEPSTTFAMTTSSVVPTTITEKSPNIEQTPLTSQSYSTTITEKSPNIEQTPLTSQSYLTTITEKSPNIEQTPLTSQSYSTSISSNVKKNESSETMTEKVRRNDVDLMGTTSKNSKDTEVTFDHVAMMVLNHARSIDYLSKTSKSSGKYKRRRNYTPRTKRPAKKKLPVSS